MGASIGSAGRFGGAWPAQHSPRYFFRFTPRNSICWAALPSGIVAPQYPQRSFTFTNTHVLKTVSLSPRGAVRGCISPWPTRRASADPFSQGGTRRADAQSSRETRRARSRCACSRTMWAFLAGRAVYVYSRPSSSCLLKTPRTSFFPINPFGVEKKGSPNAQTRESIGDGARRCPVAAHFPVHFQVKPVKAPQSIVLRRNARFSGTKPM